MNNEEITTIDQPNEVIQPENNKDIVYNNVLITCMSTLGKKSINYYKKSNKSEEADGDSYYECVSQLEPQCKVVIDRLKKENQENKNPDDKNQETGKRVNNLKIIAINTDKTFFLEKESQELSSQSPYAFFMSRIKDYNNGCEDNNSYYVKDEDIEDDLRLDIAIDIEEADYDSTEEDYDKKLADFTSELSKKYTSMLREKYKLAEEEQNRIPDSLTDVVKPDKVTGEDKKEDSKDKTENQKTILQSDAQKKQEEDEFDQLIQTAQKNFIDGLKNEKELRILNEKLDVEMKNSRNYTYQMLLNFQRKYKNIKALYQMQVANYTDEIRKIITLKKEKKNSANEKLQKQLNEELEYQAALEEDISEKDIELQEKENKIRELEASNQILGNIAYKLNKSIDMIKDGYEDKVKNYIKQEVWKKKEKANNNITAEPLMIDFESVLIRNRVQEQMFEIDEKLLDLQQAFEDSLNKQERKKKNNKLRVFMDTQGGHRDNIMVLTAVAELLKQEGLYLEDTFACNFHPGNFINSIYTNMEMYQSMNLVTGIDELCKYTKSDKISNYLRSQINEQGSLLDKVPEFIDDKTIADLIMRLLKNQKGYSVESILNQIAELCDCISLCKVETIDKQVIKIHQTIIDNIKNCQQVQVWISEKKNTVDGDEEKKKLEKIATLLNLVKYTFTKINKLFIRPALSEDSEGNFSTDIVQLAKWCKERDLIQQSLTLCAEKTIDMFIIRNDLIRLDDCVFRCLDEKPEVLTLGNHVITDQEFNNITISIERNKIKERTAVNDDISKNRLKFFLTTYDNIGEKSISIRGNNLRTDINDVQANKRFIKRLLFNQTTKIYEKTSEEESHSSSLGTVCSFEQSMQEARLYLTNAELEKYDTLNESINNDIKNTYSLKKLCLDAVSYKDAEGNYKKIKDLKPEERNCYLFLFVYLKIIKDIRNGVNHANGQGGSEEKRELVGKVSTFISYMADMKKLLNI